MRVSVPPVMEAPPPNVFALLSVNSPSPALVMLLVVEVPPLPTTPVIDVLPEPSIVMVRLVAVVDRFTGPENVRLPADKLFVTMRDNVSLTVPLNSILLVPVNVLSPPRLMVALAIALAPLRFVLAEVLTPLIPTLLVPNAALLPRINVPELNVVVPL